MDLLIFILITFIRIDFPILVVVIMPTIDQFKVYLTYFIEYTICSYYNFN